MGNSLLLKTEKGKEKICKGFQISDFALDKLKDACYSGMGTHPQTGTRV